MDRVERLGCFLELETVCQETELAERQALLCELADALGLEGSEGRSYLELLLAVDDES